MGWGDGKGSLSSLQIFVSLKSKIIFKERDKGEQQGTFVDISRVTREKTRSFLRNVMVMGCETLIICERPRRNNNR